MVHQTIIGKPEQNPLSTNSTIEQVQGVSAEITLEKPAKAQVDGDMLPETKHIRFSWIITRYRARTRRRFRRYRQTGVEREYVGYANETAADRTGRCRPNSQTTTSDCAEMGG